MQQDIDKTNVCLFPFTLQISHTLVLDFDTNLQITNYKLQFTNLQITNNYKLYGQLQNFHH